MVSYGFDLISGEGDFRIAVEYRYVNTVLIMFIIWLHLVASRVVIFVGLKILFLVMMTTVL